MPPTFCPGVTSPVLHPISDSGPPSVVPEGTATQVSLTQASYLAVAPQGLSPLDLGQDVRVGVDLVIGKSGWPQHVNACRPRRLLSPWR
jgi:hypothetical protein